MNANLAFGTDETLDIITWNVQNFPKHNSTLNYLLQLIRVVRQVRNHYILAI